MPTAIRKPDMDALIPNPASVKRNLQLRRVLEVIANHPTGMSSREIRDAFGWSVQRSSEYISIMLCGEVIDRHRPLVDGRKAVYRYRVIADAAGIDRFLADLAAQFAKKLGQQRLAIRTLPPLLPPQRYIPPPRSTTVNNYQRAALGKTRALYDFIAANPGCTLVQIAEHFGTPTSTTRTILYQLRDAEHTMSVEGARHPQRGQVATKYFVSGKGRPEVPPPTRRAAENDDKIDLPCRRPRIVATQIGMQRDPLVAALFGQVGA